MNVFLRTEWTLYHWLAMVGRFKYRGGGGGGGGCAYAISRNSPFSGPSGGNLRVMLVRVCGTVF